MQTVKELRKIGNHSDEIERLFEKCVSNVPKIATDIINESERKRKTSKKYKEKIKKNFK